MAKREMRSKTVEAINNEVVNNEAVESEATKAVIEKKKLGKVVECKRLNIRKRPVIDSDVVTIIENGSTVEIVDIEKATGDWYKVRYGTETEGYTGYCVKKYIKLV